MWSSTTAPITVSLIVVNSTTGEVVAKMPSVPRWMVEAPAGVRTDVYGSAVSSFATSLLPGIDMPDANGSVSGMACGHKTICVGAFTTRTTWTTLSGYSYSYTSPGAVNSISKFSSWGDLIDGRRMPFITAPGMGINSVYF